MGSTIQSYAIVFADVSGSSRLYKETGNDAAKAVIDGIVDAMRVIINSHDGRVIKTIGDEIMACFDNCNNAALAAQTIQRNTRDSVENQPLQLRIGIDFGEILEAQGDLFGDVVNDAAFVSRIARGGQTVMTEKVLSELDISTRNQCREFDRITLKGGQEKTSLYLLQGEQTTPQDADDMTLITGVPDITSFMGSTILALHYKNLHLELNATDTPFSMGRSKGKVSLQVETSFASREHCQIIHRRGKFVLCDHSTNGTYISQSNRPEIYLRREELPLSGNGVISIGQSVNNDQMHLISYVLNNSQV